MTISEGVARGSPEGRARTNTTLRPFPIRRAPLARSRTFNPGWPLPKSRAAPRDLVALRSRRNNFFAGHQEIELRAHASARQPQSVIFDSALGAQKHRTPGIIASQRGRKGRRSGRPERFVRKRPHAEQQSAFRACNSKSANARDRCGRLAATGADHRPRSTSNYTAAVGRTRTFPSIAAVSFARVRGELRDAT